MDILFYFFVGVSCTILLLAMWAFAARDVNRWGPDLTMELPPEVIKDSLARHWRNSKSNVDTTPTIDVVEPTAPADDAACPLLCKPPVPARPKRIAPPKPNRTKPVFANTVVRVLPENAIRHHRLKTTTFIFNEDQPAYNA